ncbi:hypothetical protein CMI39_00100 [Candidatus Pacearchaeota archaeon]|jgi:hypothetical protein|nr:hypothetical protein [Candidatus Pacearchaeota archaeon]|tara:strand:+ start:85 stop:531 length:447 start_codon:yes stop_codon:yes gene_type:complete
MTLDNKKFHKSENRIYILKNFVNSLDDLNNKKLFNFSEEFFERFVTARNLKVGEDIYCELETSLGRTINKGFEICTFLEGPNVEVNLDIERLYFSSEGKLMSAGNFNLARIKREKKDLILKVAEHHTIGINPDFLYKIGEKYGKRFNI